MTKMFADAFYFIALLNPSDRFHHTVVTRTGDHHFAQAGFHVMLRG